MLCRASFLAIKNKNALGMLVSSFNFSEERVEMNLNDNGQSRLA